MADSDVADYNKSDGDAGLFRLDEENARDAENSEFPLDEDCARDAEKVALDAAPQIFAPKVAPDTSSTELKNDFICFCLEVVKDPVMCIPCSTLFCNDCMTDWRSRQNTCPKCRAAINIVPAPRFMKNTLDEHEFKC